MNEKLQSKLLKIAYANLELPQGRQKHFSFILKKKRIISFGWNNGWKTHPLSKEYGHRFDSLHAEVMAVNNVPYGIDLAECKLVNVRIIPSGFIGLSHPCFHCRKLIHDLKFKEVYYSSPKGFQRYV
jgi:tRNA(Arg) A34 adenosine deaminase TadA